MSLSSILKEFDEKYELIGSVAPTTTDGVFVNLCGIRSFLISAIKEALEEVTPKRMETKEKPENLSDNLDNISIIARNTAIVDMKQNIFDFLNS